MRVILKIILVILLALLLISADENPPFLTASDALAQVLSHALEQRLQLYGTDLLTFQLFTPELDTAFIASDGNTAVLWLALRDDYGRMLASEPGLALAQHVDGQWQVLLPGDANWQATITSLPLGMRPVEWSPVPADSNQNIQAEPQALSGYYLPYVAGTSRWLEGSIGHFQDIPWLGYPSCSVEYCRYAFDFTDSWHFPIVASKGGIVFARRDSCADSNTLCTNYIVLRDTNNNTYQIYMHLAHGTIPDKLTPGTTVLRGQYLADSDDTGYSTSQHVHYMVTTSVWLTDGDQYYWGRSVDIRFADVLINNGIPRTCYEVTAFPTYDGATQCIGNKADPRNPNNDWFLSGNQGAFPPSGELTRPVQEKLVNTGANPLIDVSAKASDDVRVKAVQLIAMMDGSWKELKPRITQPASAGFYDWDVNLCEELGPYDGLLEVALKVWDHEGNLVSGITPRTIHVDHACPMLPSSQLNPADSTDSTALHLSWTSGLSDYPLTHVELQWRQEPGTWQTANTIILPADSLETWFIGEPGMTYAFRLRAVDNKEQIEPWPENDAAETVASIPSICTPDSDEPDDDTDLAHTLIAGSSVQNNLCGAADSDWYWIAKNESNVFHIKGISLSGGAAVRILLYGADGATLLADAQAEGIAQDVELTYRLVSTGGFFIKVSPLSDNLWGTDARYELSISSGHEIYMPLFRN